MAVTVVRRGVELGQMIAAALVGCHGPDLPCPGDDGAPAARADSNRSAGPGADPGALTVETPRALRDLVAEAPAGTVVRWEVDGADAGVVGTRVPARRLVPGQVWTAVADGARASVQIPEPPGGNVLIVLLDDVGVDQVGAYGLNPAAAPTPTIDALAAEGIRFDQAWASPLCSPTRAMVLTGRHPRRSGVGWIIDTGDHDFALPLEAVTIPEALGYARTGPWSTSAVGKWHLAARWSATDWLRHPLDQGFGWYAGTIGNPSYQQGWGYWRWDRDENGVEQPSTTYLTTATADDALARVTEMPEPWLLYVAFNAAHTPWSAPPPELTTLEVTDGSPDPLLFDATLEALDTELGRLLAGIDPEVRARTTIVVLGDNGTPDRAIDPPYDPDEGKHTVHELGVRVPLIVVGPHVARPGSVSRALVHAVDLLPTVAEIAGVPLGGPDEALVLDLPDPVPLDGRSLLPYLDDPEAPSRDRLYTETFFPSGTGSEWSIDRRALRDARYKLIRNTDGSEQLYELGAGVLEGPDLLDRPTREAKEVHRRLARELDCLAAELVYEGR